MEVIAGDQLHRLLHAAGIVQNQPQHGGGGQIRPLRLLISGHGLRPLVGHIDPAGHPRVVDPVQGHVGSRQHEDPLRQPVRVPLLSDTQELEVDGGHRGVPSPAGISVDDAGIGPGEVVIPGKQPVPLRRGRGEGGTGDGALADGHGDQVLGDLPGNKINQLLVRGGPAP